MPIDERLRSGLASNTALLVPDVETALVTTYGRTRRRQRVRRSALALAAAAAIAVTAWAVDLSGLDDDAVPVVPVVPAPRTPTDLVGVQGPLEPGSYSMAVWGQGYAADPLPRAILELPEGYFSNGGYVIDAGLDGVTDDQLGDISVWHVVQVLTDPCRRRTAADVGPTVPDLARALTHQTGPSTRPKPVILDGHRGLTLEVTIPPDTDLSRCTNGQYSLWTAEPRDGSALSQTTPGLVNRLWILDVDGTRLVLLASLYPDQTDELHQEQTTIAEAVRFEPASQP